MAKWSEFAAGDTFVGSELTHQMRLNSEYYAQHGAVPWEVKKEYFKAYLHNRFVERPLAPLMWMLENVPGSEHFDEVRGIYYDVFDLTRPAPSRPGCKSAK